HFAHDELLALAHLSVGLQERGNTRNREVVQPLALGAIASLSFVELFCLPAIVFCVFARILVRRGFRASEIERAQRRDCPFHKIEQRLIGARCHCSCTAEPARITAPIQRTVLIVERTASWRSPRKKG